MIQFILRQSNRFDFLGRTLDYLGHERTISRI